MAIRFTPEFNKEIRRIVHNFNQKRNRAIKRGYTHLPDPLTVSELKNRYESKTLLKRDLKLLSEFNTGRDEALKTVETSGGAKAIKWEYDYLKKNLQYAKRFYDREIRDASALDTPMAVAKAEYLNNLKAKREYLEMELADLNQSQFNTYKATINEYLEANQRYKSGYRSWMNEIETIMRQLGYDNKTINKFFEGFDRLTPRQFLTMYRQNAIVSRIYELYIPTKEGEFRLSTTEDDAKDLISTFMIEKEEMINKAIESDKQIKAISKEMLGEELQTPKNKLNRKDLTPEQIQKLKELGWEDLIE